MVPTGGRSKGKAIGWWVRVRSWLAAACTPYSYIQQIVGGRMMWESVNGKVMPYRYE